MTQQLLVGRLSRATLADACRLYLVRHCIMVPNRCRGRRDIYVAPSAGEEKQ